jgi:hypothetical protein
MTSGRAPAGVNGKRSPSDGEAVRPQGDGSTTPTLNASPASTWRASRTTTTTLRRAS